MSTAVISPVSPFAGDAKSTILSVMRRDRDKFTRLVSDTKNWNVMTRSAGWEVRDLVGHMIDVMEGYFKNWDLAKKGDAASTAGMEVMGTSLNDHALDFRKLSREEALDRFKKDAQKLDGMLEALTADEWGTFIVMHPYGGPVPGGAYATFQIMDYAVHGYDIEYGLGNKLATIDEASAGLILPFTFIFWSATVDQNEARGLDMNYGVHIAGPWGGKWRCTVKDGKFTYAPETGDFEGCDALFFYPTVQEEVFTFFGRFPGGAAQGDPAAIEKVRHLFFPF
jgi:uncharacterized protein (TIGR03083 family)